VVAILSRQREAIVDAIRAMYTAVAVQPQRGFHFPIGRAACEYVGYPAELLDRVPAAALESFAGVACPFDADVLRPGDVVLDVGCGSGVDAIVASHLVGPAGIVCALDLTGAMCDKLRLTTQRSGLTNVRVLYGDAEAIPLCDGTVTVVTSNAALNLVPDKRRAVAEIARVLRPGGSLQIADILLAAPVTDVCRDDPEMWAECVVGATTEADFLALLRDAGFGDVEVLGHVDYFAASPNAETRRVAQCFGAMSAVLRARKVGMNGGAHGGGASVPAVAPNVALAPRDGAGAGESFTGVDHVIDAGNMGCGDVTLLLRKELKLFAPGTVVALRSRVPAVAEELPAWCRMTGNHFMRTDTEADAQVHYIRKKTS
jgi:arsenite methyltransferase